MTIVEDKEIETNDFEEQQDGQDDYSTMKLPPWHKQITVRGLVASFIIGVIYIVIVMKLNVTTGTTGVAEDIGRQLLTYGRRLSFTELFARIDAVDASTVKRVANRFIFDQDVAIAAMGPIQSLPDYNWFRRRT